MSLSQEEIIIIENSLKNKLYKDIPEQPKISIIVPCFNTEKYIAKCLFSLINQTEEQIEIICVNDGSDDDTQKIITLFAEYDSRIKIINQEHLLQGSARNNGIKNAKGEYLGFVDSDDWIDLSYYEELYAAAKRYDSDIALATNVRIGNGKTKKRINILKEEFITDMQEKIDVCRQWKDGCPTNKIYRADFLRKHNVLFPEGVYCEDKIFTMKSLFFANGIVTVPDICYFYFRNPNSTVNKKFKTRKYKQDKYKAKLDVLNFLKEQNAKIRDKDFWAVTKKISICGIPVYTKKESLHTVNHFLFSFIKIKEEQI